MTCTAQTRTVRPIELVLYLSRPDTTGRQLIAMSGLSTPAEQSRRICELAEQPTGDISQAAYLASGMADARGSPAHAVRRPPAYRYRGIGPRTAHEAAPGWNAWRGLVCLSAEFFTRPPRRRCGRTHVAGQTDRRA
jgi:hypothetical protein